MAELYKYPLGPDDIRLLTIVGESSGILCCQLDTVLRENATYNALSYAWGCTDQTNMIVCNNAELRVTPSLSIALHHIYQSSIESWHPLWVDAICLNQDDIEEKRVHIPRMFEIYSQAQRVIVWLGPAAENSDMVFDSIPRYQSELATFRKSYAFGLPSQNDPFWSELGKLSRRTWFNRLWTLQEVVLGKSKILMCGTRLLAWDTFTDLIQLTKGGGCRLKILPEMTSDFTNANSIINCSHPNTLENLRTNENRAEYFLRVLNLTRFRECWSAVDHIYGVLGLLHPETRKDIEQKSLVNYAFSPTDLFVKITRRYLLTSSVGFDLLSIASSTLRNLAMPSWCPDWTSEPLYNRNFSTVTSYRAGILSAPAHVSSIILGNCTKSIYVRGLTVDVVQLIGKPWLNLRNGMISDKDDQDLRIWEQSCLSVAASTLKSPDFLTKYTQTLIGNVVGSTALLCTEDFSEEYRRWKIGMDCSNNNLHGPNLEAAKQNRFRTAMVPNSKGRSLFGTLSGRIGMGPHNLRSGDQVCIFLNGRPPYILRKTDKPLSQKSAGLKGFDEMAETYKVGDIVYELIGEAYINGLMDGEAFVSSQRGDDELFCIV